VWLKFWAQSPLNISSHWQHVLAGPGTDILSCRSFHIVPCPQVSMYISRHICTRARRTTCLFLRWRSLHLFPNPQASNSQYIILAIYEYHNCWMGISVEDMYTFISQSAGLYEYFPPYATCARRTGNVFIFMESETMRSMRRNRNGE
jgi:hypothetical protein